MARTKLLIRSLTLYFLHLAVHCENTEQERGEVQFKALCSRSCEPSQEKPSHDKFPLYQCSCTPSCRVYGDCCFDSKYRNESVWPKTDFICLSLIGHGTYRAVSGCPSDQLSNFCIDGLGHLPPVTSRTTNITYANIFCAICNGDGEDLVKWNVELSCSSGLDDEFEESKPEDTTRIISQFGDIWKLNEADGSKRLCMYRVHFEDFSFLRGLELRRCTSNSKISDCSASWKDLSTMQMCRSYTDPVYFHNTLFANSHCAQCNYLNTAFAQCLPFHLRTALRIGVMAGANIGRFCESRGSQACIESLLASPRGRPYPFANLLRIHEEACVPKRGRRCCEGEAFDFITQRCRKTVSG